MPEPPELPSTPRVPPPPGDVPSALLAPVADVDVAGDGRQLRLRLAGGDSGCGHEAYVRDGDPVVVVVHQPLGGGTAAGACRDDGPVVTVELAEPLGNRTVVDAATGRVVHDPGGS